MICQWLRKESLILSLRQFWTLLIPTGNVRGSDGQSPASLCPPCSIVPVSHRDGHVSLQEYMAFMISRETENVKSSEEIESAFRALSSEGKPYVTKEELYQVGLGTGTADAEGCTASEA